MWEKFIDHISGLITEVRNSQGGNLEESAKLVAKTIESGGIIHTFGTGHSSLLAQEIFCRAGGVVPVNAILDPCFLLSYGAIRSSSMERTQGIASSAIEGHTIRSGDVAIIISNSGRNVAPVEMALKLKKMGLSIIALTSLKHSETVKSGHPSEKKLYDLADVVLDNLGPRGDASFKVPGIKAPMGATSGIIGAILLHCVIIEAASILSSKGKAPAVFQSINAETEQLEELTKEFMKYKGRIKHF